MGWDLLHEDRMLIVAPVGRDGPLTCALLAKAGIPCEPCADVEAACREVETAGAAGLILTEESLHPAAVERLAQALAAQPPWSDLPLILFTGEGAAQRDPARTSRLLARLGNVTLLDRPIRPINMISAAQWAVRSRRRQYTAREELREKQRAVAARDQFLAMLGHELRNPLAAIRLAASILEDGTDGVDSPAAIIQRQAAHLTRLVDDLLDVARVTAGKIVLVKSVVDVGALVTRSLKSLEGALQARRVKLTLDGIGPPPSVEGDPVRLEQVVVNLLHNAVKYTPSGGCITVAVAREDGRAVISIQDDGTGIEPEMLPRIFELFAQVERTLDRAQGGLGIGLTLVRQLVELHGGTIEASSAGLGRGSTFTVRLPLASRPAQAPAPEPRAHPEPRERPAVGYDILVVEDNADIRMMLCVLLRSGGHRVHSVGDGHDAVERAVKTRPDVILLDIGLPGLDGYQVARAVREALGPGVLLVAMTGYGQEADRRQAQEAGFDAHITKPVEPEALEALLAAHRRDGSPTTTRPATRLSLR